ncbi:hypothetical protein TNCV_4748041 [Trichonephila clavipes]|nr:hypothetical protein TNCV_4748041 [Trichonephila clavipes]
METFRRCMVAQACVDPMMMPDHHPDEPFYVRALTELQDIEDHGTGGHVLTNNLRAQENRRQRKLNGSNNSASQNVNKINSPPPIMLGRKELQSPNGCNNESIPQNKIPPNG